MIDIDRFSQTVAQIYDASLSVERWDAALASLSALFASPMAQLSYFDSMSDPHPLFRLVGFEPGAIEGLMDKYRTLTLTDPRQPPRMFKPYHCRQLVSDDTLRASAIYQQALEPVGIEYSMFVMLDLPGDASCVVSLMRGPGLYAFNETDCEDFGRFVPHIGRAVSMSGALRRARDMVVAAQGLIDAVPMGMIVLQDDRIVLANAAASRLLDQGDGLRRSGAGLQAASPDGQAELVRALRAARSGAGGPVGVTFPAGDTGQLRAVVTRVEPASLELLDVGPGAVALYLTDSRHPIETREEVVRRLFGLTEREAAVLCALVEGQTPQEIAARLGVGLQTVKTHLQHIMQTTGVRRQAALVKLVLSSPAWIGDLRAEPPRIPLLSPPNE